MLQKAYKCIILSADDDQDDQLFMQDALSELDLNCEAKYFPNGQVLINSIDDELKEMLLCGNPCMIFLDLNMPQLNGKETLMYLRSQIQFFNLPVFILSTTAGENEIQECYELGANAVFQKPPDFDLFKNLLLGVYNHWMQFLIPATQTNVIAGFAESSATPV